jgi:hypothetical protein
LHKNLRGLGKAFVALVFLFLDITLSICDCRLTVAGTAYAVATRMFARVERRVMHAAVRPALSLKLSFQTTDWW